MVCAAAGGHAHVCGPTAQRAVLMSVVCVTTKGHADINGLCAAT